VVRAAVMTAVNRPLEVRDDIEVHGPGPGEVVVRLAASGVCHTDLSVLNGTTLAPVPIVLGHEGAGVVSEVGEGVTTVRPGDRVVTCWVPQCGDCYFCARDESHLCEASTIPLASGGLLDGTTRLTSGGAPLFQLSATGTFSEAAVVPESGVVRLDAEMDLEVAALLGCAVLTGVGAATRTAPVTKGDTVAVVGCGGVGLNVIQGARLQGAARILAVDVNPAKLRLAQQFGATDVVDAGEADAAARVLHLTGERGADISFEVVGIQETIDQTIAMTRRGGQAVLVGLPGLRAQVNVPAFFGVVLGAKTIKGCWYGSSNVQHDVPRLAELYVTGELQLDELVSKTISLDEVNDAFEDMRSGQVARSVIRYP
jgi:S-(hydroxymethyl)glutathione dehydrogenase/alcohol dehydrogenase